MGRIQQIAIDAGGTLMKIAFFEQGKIHTKIYSNENIEECIEWLNMVAPDAVFHLTGGKLGFVSNRLKQKSVQIDEFSAIITGTRYLLKEQFGLVDERVLTVSIGTGTSIFSVTENSFERMIGSGIGGGTLMGLGKLLSGKEDFTEIVTMAQAGKRETNDILVKDIYGPDTPPIMGDLTAANFGKVRTPTSTADQLASLIQMIGETILLLATEAATAKQVNKIVFVGSTLAGNYPLKKVLTSFRDILNYEPLFLDNGPYAGAIGALLTDA